MCWTGTATGPRAWACIIHSSQHQVQGFLQGTLPMARGPSLGSGTQDVPHGALSCCQRCRNEAATLLPQCPPSTQPLHKPCRPQPQKSATTLTHPLHLAGRCVVGGCSQETDSDHTCRLACTHSYTHVSTCPLRPPRLAPARCSVPSLASAISFNLITPQWSLLKTHTWLPVICQAPVTPCSSGNTANAPTGLGLEPSYPILGTAPPCLPACSPSSDSGPRSPAEPVVLDHVPNNFLQRSRFLGNDRILHLKVSRSFLHRFVEVLEPEWTPGPSRVISEYLQGEEPRPAACPTTDLAQPVSRMGLQ